MSAIPLIATASDDEVSLWEGGGGEEPLATFEPHLEPITALRWTSNDRVLASASHDGTIALSEPSGKLFHTLQAQPSSGGASSAVAIHAITWSPGSRYLAAGGSDAVVRIFDLQKRAQALALRGHRAAVRGLSWSPSEVYVASSSDAGEIIVHRVQGSVAAVARIEHPAAEGMVRPGLGAVQWAPFHPSMLACAAADGGVAVWEVKPNMPAGPPHRLFAEHTEASTGLQWSPVNQHLLASCSMDATICFYDVTKQCVVRTLRSHRPLTCLAFASSGVHLALGSISGELFIFDLRSDRPSPSWTVQAHTSTVRAIAFQRASGAAASGMSGGATPTTSGGAATPFGGASHAASRGGSGTGSPLLGTTPPLLAAREAMARQAAAAGGRRHEEEEEEDGEDDAAEEEADEAEAEAEEEDEEEAKAKAEELGDGYDEAGDGDSGRAVAAATGRFASSGGGLAHSPALGHGSAGSFGVRPSWLPSRLLGQPEGSSSASEIAISSSASEIAISSSASESMTSLAGAAYVAPAAASVSTGTRPTSAPASHAAAAPSTRPTATRALLDSAPANVAVAAPPKARSAWAVADAPAPLARPNASPRAPPPTVPVHPASLAPSQPCTPSPAHAASEIAISSSAASEIAISSTAHAAAPALPPAARGLLPPTLPASLVPTLAVAQATAAAALSAAPPARGLGTGHWLGSGGGGGTAMAPLLSEQLEGALYDLRASVQEDLRALHLEMLRELEAQRHELREIVLHERRESAELRLEVERLRQENARLRSPLGGLAVGLFGTS